MGSANVKGLKATIDALKLFEKKLAKRAELALKEAAVFLLNEALEIVPVDLGVLRASGEARTEPRSGGGFETVGVVSFSTDYALAVHEDLTKAHGLAYNIKYMDEINRGAIDPSTGRMYHRRGVNQQAKYLEDPMVLKQKEIFRILKENLEKP